jgi:hypothetical protein
MHFESARRRRFFPTQPDRLKAFPTIVGRAASLCSGLATMVTRQTTGLN